jgi:hypothetical protein
MAKYTLLELTQSILNAMDSDNVNSIDDTVESIQVAELVKESFFDLISQRDWPFMFDLDSLIALSDLNNPTKMQMKDTWNKIKWIRYNKQEVEYLSPSDFTELLDNRTAQANVVDANGIVLTRDPTYWTTYDDEYVVFDAYNASVESTLQQQKTKVYASIQPTWTHSDTFVPDIPEKMFQILLSDSKAQAFVNLKQQSNAREERKAQRAKVIMRNEAWRNEYGETKYNKRVNYGRK